tara:strand:+ start:1007 stop:1312 length:306 start_codon:yes stop_codon:yes gene_type:complete
MNDMSIHLLEKKILLLLNRLKENHLELKQLRDSKDFLESNEKKLNEMILNLKKDNNSLKAANNLLGSKDGRINSRRKINKLLKDVEYCIFQLSEIDNSNNE